MRTVTSVTDVTLQLGLRDYEVVLALYLKTLFW